MRNLDSVRLLFVCESAVDRSPTFSKYFNERSTSFESHYKGIDAYYEKDQLELIHLNQATFIFVMTLKELFWIESKFPKFNMARVIVIGIDNSYSNGDAILERMAKWFYDKYCWRLNRTGSLVIPKSPLDIYVDSKVKIARDNQCCDMISHKRVHTIVYKCEHCNTIIITNGRNKK